MPPPHVIDELNFHRGTNMLWKNDFTKYFLRNERISHFSITFYVYITAMSQAINAPVSQRLLSLDFMRGCIMILLAAESTGLYEHLFEATTGQPLLNGFFLQFFHHPWNGLRFWDLIQPSFMFMAGVAMAFSLNKQQQQGISWKESFSKTLRRCFWLFFWGVLDYA